MIPYRPISKLYLERFGTKVYKVPVSLSEDCPNRQGLKGMQTCIFCDEWGSAARSEILNLDLRTQIETVRETIRTHRNAPRFLIYFQAYTNTFLRLTKLREAFEIALSYPDVVGLIIGTRPDCLSKAVLDLWKEYSEKTFVSIEMGVQSFYDDQLEFLRRGHTVEQSITAIQKIKTVRELDLGVHLMFGLPGETDEHIMKTAEIINTLPIDHVKLHNLHVLINTPLEGLYRSGHFVPIEREIYTHRVSLFLRHLSPTIAVDRLAAYSSRRNELVAPDWTERKMETYQYIIDSMNAAGHRQGQFFELPREITAP